jgi:methionyl-tRNA synthetase
MTLAQEANRYLEETSPWKTIKVDKQAAATALYVAVNVISALRTMLYPFLPFSSEKLHRWLGFTGSVADDGWCFVRVTAGQRLSPSGPFFIKLDEGLIEEETARLGSAPI